MSEWLLEDDALVRVHQVSLWDLLEATVPSGHGMKAPSAEVQSACSDRLRAEVLTDAGKEVVAAWAIDHMNMGPEFFSQTWMSRTLSSPPPTGVVHSFEHPEGPVVTVDARDLTAISVGCRPSIRMNELGSTSRIQFILARMMVRVRDSINHQTASLLLKAAAEDRNLCDLDPDPEGRFLMHPFNYNVLQNRDIHRQWNLDSMVPRHELYALDDHFWMRVQGCRSEPIDDGPSRIGWTFWLDVKMAVAPGVSVVPVHSQSENPFLPGIHLNPSRLRFVDIESERT